MFVEPDISFTTLPIPPHQGIIISSKTLRELSLDEIKGILICESLECGFESLTENIKLKFIITLNQDTLWMVKWNRENEQNIGLVLGSEF